MPKSDGRILNADAVKRISRVVKHVEGQGESPPLPGGRRYVGMGRLVRFRLIEIHEDYLTCRRWDGINEGDVDVYVAKPFMLQQTPHDGVSRNGFTAGSYAATTAVTRTVTKDADQSTENQVIVPSYQVADGAEWDGDEIYAIAANTDVTVGTAELVVKLIDANLDGRAWAEEYTP